MNIQKIDEITEKTIDGLLNGSVTPQTAKAISGVLHQNISAIRLALDYAKMKGGDASVPALEFAGRKRGYISRPLREFIAAFPGHTFTIVDLEAVIEKHRMNRMAVSALLIRWVEEGILKRVPKPEGQRENIYALGPEFEKKSDDEDIAD